MDVNFRSMLNLPRPFMVPVYRIQVFILVNVVMQVTMGVSDVP